jgi:hypothetical protein
VDIVGITVHPDERWMQQIARNVTMEGCGALRDCRCCTIATPSTPSPSELKKAHFSVIAVKPERDKVTRMSIQTGKFESGQVFSRNRRQSTRRSGRQHQSSTRA